MQFIQCSVLFDIDTIKTFRTVDEAIFGVENFQIKQFLNAKIDISLEDKCAFLWFGSRDALLESLMNF
ncbi:MAG: hypothetical protein V7735_23250 [Photobacterium frigidiphilum]|uniref:hypothetical protein n=1 Tax=Photobacterium frigidiphilum TaxID=264736 RepID=UPI003001F436